MSTLLLLILASGTLVGFAHAWRERAGRRVVMALASLLSSVGMCGLLFPPTRPLAATTLQVITAGAVISPADQPAADVIRVALPGSPAVAGSERVPDLATALRRHPSTRALHIVGAGLPARDRDAARAWPLRFDPAPLPRGVVELQLPDEVLAGHHFVVGGRVHGVDDAQLRLLDPSGVVVARAGADGDGRFQLSAFARRAAELNFVLQLADAQGTTVEQLPLPVAVRDGDALRLLLLSGGPDPDLKYLRRWALDAGHRLRSRTLLSRGIAQRDGDTRLTAAQLAETDLVIVDERAWAQLSSDEREALSSAVGDGLGVLLRITGTPAASVVQEWTTLGIPLQKSTVATTLQLAPASADAVTLQRAAWQGISADALPLLAASDNAPLAIARNRGHGRVAVWWLQSTYRLVLAGQAARHDGLWAAAVGAVARPIQLARPRTTVPAWVDERLVVCGDTPQLTLSNAAGVSSTTPATRQRDGWYCGGWWPRQRGWHGLGVDAGRHAFFVYGSEDATALQQARTTALTQALVGAGSATAAVASGPGPRWPWFIAWLLPTTLSWWLPRRRPAGVGTNTAAQPPAIS